MGCLDGIQKIITSTCENTPIAGTEVKAWVGNRLEATFTYDVTNESMITDIQMATTKQLYSLTGVKKLLNPGSSLVVAEDRPDTYQHSFNFQGFEFLAEDVENIDALADIFVVVEMKNKGATGEGTFRCFGPENGLYKSSMEWTANDIDGAIPVELTSEEGANESYPWYTVFDTDYATTKAMLEAQETPQP